MKTYSNSNEKMFKVIDEDEYKRISEQAKHWCLVNGFVYNKDPFNNKDTITHLPFTLFPSPFSYDNFEQALSLQSDINLLVHRIGSCPCLLESIFAGIVHSDEFIGNLWKIYKRALSDGYNQSINLIIIRTDYMLNKAKGSKCAQNAYNDMRPRMKQVEINTISVGFAVISTKMTELHKKILKWTKNEHLLPMLPENNPLDSVSNAIVEAWRLYLRPNAKVLWIVLDHEKNISDQRHLEYAIIDKEPCIEVMRCTLAELNDYGYLSNSKELYFKNNEISIVYFRAGYSPEHYKSHKEWNALLMIESSKAIKCPSVGVFLAGMKVVQEYMSNDENLNRITEENYELNAKLKNVFGKYYNLDSYKNIDDALKNPQNYVLKPQREGGSNNYYDADIVEILKNNNFDKDRYVLMERYNPVSYENYIIRAQKPNCKQSLDNSLANKTLINCELGVFGAIVRDDRNVYFNETSGYCLRSKPIESNECGVMCGDGCLDSIYFYD